MYQLSHTVRQNLNLTQTLRYKQILCIEQNMKHPFYPNMVKGLEGMLKAHKILQEQNLPGILIGGLSRKVWGQKNRPERLLRHKDVDVLVPYGGFEGKEFEGGIDWWLTKKGRINIYISKDSTSFYTYVQKWHENVAGIVLSYIAEFPEDKKELKPGLNIPDLRWIVNLKECEIRANLDNKIIKTENKEKMIARFRCRVLNRGGKTLPRFIKEEFKDNIIPYEAHPTLKPLDTNILLGIKSRGNQEKYY